MSHVDHAHGWSLPVRCDLPGSVGAPEGWALVALNLLALEHEGFKGVPAGEVPVDVGLVLSLFRLCDPPPRPCTYPCLL